MAEGGAHQMDFDFDNAEHLSQVHVIVQKTGQRTEEIPAPPPSLATIIAKDPGFTTFVANKIDNLYAQLVAANRRAERKREKTKSVAEFLGNIRSQLVAALNQKYPDNEVTRARALREIEHGLMRRDSEPRSSSTECRDIKKKKK